MSLSRDEVLNVAKLARLKFPEQEIEKFRTELNTILDYIDMLDEIDTSDVAPLINVNDGNNNLREDIARPSATVEEALFNAPTTVEGTVAVPRVVGE
jgi:aspartyl-tRNA(Asn)/glutamyl-tRNA(Gln) amidotransferase subunit C